MDRQELDRAATRLNSPCADSSAGGLNCASDSSRAASAKLGALKSSLDASRQELSGPDVQCSHVSAQMSLMLIAGSLVEVIKLAENHQHEHLANLIEQAATEALNVIADSER